MVEKLRLLGVKVDQYLLNRLTGTCGVLLALEAIPKGPQGFRVLLSVPKNVAARISPQSDTL